MAREIIESACKFMWDRQPAPLEIPYRTRGRRLSLLLIRVATGAIGALRKTETVGTFLA